MAIKFLRMEFRGYEILLPFHNIRGFGNLKPLVKTLYIMKLRKWHLHQRKSNASTQFFYLYAGLGGDSLLVVESSKISYQAKEMNYLVRKAQQLFKLLFA
jgi:hypothetical protein